jgi:hypothetical protein
MYVPRIDTAHVPGTLIRYTVYNPGPGYFVTAFVGIPIQWFFLEARVKFPVSKPYQHPDIVKSILGVPTTIFNLSAYYTFPRKYYRNPK